MRYHFGILIFTRNGIPPFDRIPYLGNTYFKLSCEVRSHHPNYHLKSKQIFWYTIVKNTIAMLHLVGIKNIMQEFVNSWDYPFHFRK